MVTNISMVVRKALENGFQIEPKAFEIIKGLEEKDVNVRKFIQEVMEKKIVDECERRITEQDMSSILSLLGEDQGVLTEKVEIKTKVVIKKIERTQLLEGKEGFESLFKSRYNKLMMLVHSRPDHFYIETISSVKNNRGKGRRKISGLVMSKRLRRKNAVLTLDDNTGILETLAVDKRIIDKVREILLDSFVIVDIEFSGRDTAIIKSINPPDIPEQSLTLSKEKVYTVFTSDLHVGSKNFLNESFKKFIDWLGRKGKDKSIVSRIKYLIIAGDAVDGVGIYPGQETDLEELDVKKQYSKLAHLLADIPKSIQIFIIPGNHDPVGQALPQPPIPRKYAEDLYRLSNVTMLGNPVYIRLHDVNVLIYHGRSLDDVMAAIPGFTFARPAVAMKTLLRARHLAPIYGERTALAPEIEDNLVIEQIPSIFHSGHIHTLDSENYKGTLILNSGCWQAQTPYQAKMGIRPTPGIVPIVDLTNLEVFTRDFR